MESRIARVVGAGALALGLAGGCGSVVQVIGGPGPGGGAPSAVSSNDAASGSGGAPAAECQNDKQCGASNTCHTAVCGAGKCSAKDAPLGTLCMGEGGLVCDGKGACVTEHCSDGVRDYQETDVDCGQSCPNACVNGQKCANPWDCTSGYCEGKPGTCAPCGDSTQCYGATYCDPASHDCVKLQPPKSPCTNKSQCSTGFCVDGFCCDTACAGTCNHCAKATGAVADGVCTKVQKSFVGVVSNANDPKQPGSGFSGMWSYGGFLGTAAGKAMCQAIGADHVCAYTEVLQADAGGELTNLPANLTYWLHRTSFAPDYLLQNGMKACNVDADCGPPADKCDVTLKECSWKPGAGARCNDWTYPGGNLADGEWFKTLPDPAGGGVAKGSLSFHYDKDATYDGVTMQPCQDPTKVGCAGPCSGVQRAILCCAAACP